MTDDARRAQQGIPLVIAAIAFFSALDATTKAVSTLIPLAMVIWFRYLFQALVTALWLVPRSGAKVLRTRHPLLQCTRGALLTLSSALAFLSLRYMPVGEFTAIVMLTPLVITAIAAISFGERVSPLRWTLVVGGFVGALIVIRPGSERFEWTMLLPLAVVASNAAFQLTTSRLARLENAGTVHFYTGCVGAALGFVALPFQWQPLEPDWLWAVLVGMAVVSTIGHLLLIMGYGRANASTLTPYLYFQIGFAMLIGWLAFAHAPDAASLAGVALIAICGAAGTWLTAREEAALAAMASRRLSRGSRPMELPETRP